MGVGSAAATHAVTEPVVRLDDVHKRFGDNVVLEGVDLTLDPRQVLVVIGPSGSGKSTLLRTVGINAVLAFAGAPVRAGRLTLTPLVLGATLRIQDSLQEGRSRFYAEITRIRQLADTDPGTYRIVFHPSSPFFRRVELEVDLGPGHHHVPLLLSSYSCASYRGS